MEKTKAKVILAGQEFNLASEGSAEHIHELADYVNAKIDEIQRVYPSLSTTNCALLASLNIAEELFEVKADYDALDGRISQLREMPKSTGGMFPSKRPFESRQPVITK